MLELGSRTSSPTSSNTSVAVRLPDPIMMIYGNEPCIRLPAQTPGWSMVSILPGIQQASALPIVPE